MTMADYLETSPAHERPVVERLLRHVESLGPVHVEPVSVGIFLKHGETLARFAQLRTMTRFVAVGFSLRRTVRHPRITRKVIPHGGRYHHIANVGGADDLDEALLALVSEAYGDAGA